MHHRAAHLHGAGKESPKIVRNAGIIAVRQADRVPKCVTERGRVTAIRETRARRIQAGNGVGVWDAQHPSAIGGCARQRSRKKAHRP